MPGNMDIVILGLSISSSWGNGHATTYRHLARGLGERGHQLLFLERNTSWYAENRDLEQLPVGELRLYESREELLELYASRIAYADLVIVGSYVPDGIAVGRWVTENARGVTAFYDIDTPVTLQKLQDGECDYLARDQLAEYDLYLSFTGGPTLDHLELLGSPCARPLYCSVDEEHYLPTSMLPQYDLGYMGTHSSDRQVGLEQLLLEPARSWETGRFIVAGSQYPQHIAWPRNVERREHLPPDQHSDFYNNQRFTLNLTRAEMKRWGYSPSIRLFEAAACGTVVISDAWPGLDEFFQIDREILVADSPQQVLEYLNVMTDEQRHAIGQLARQRVLAEHTGLHRARELEQYFEHVAKRKSQGAL